MQPGPGDIVQLTDVYFRRSKEIVRRFGDRAATYAVFMRRPVISTPKLMVDFLEAAAAARQTQFAIELNYPEGALVGAGEPLAYVTGSLYHLVDLETLYLQKLGAACVAAYNAYAMCADLPKTAFLAMDARHCAGAEMAEMMAYAAAVGSQAAKRAAGARGFIGNATDATAHYFGQAHGFGTMPHALIGYAGSTLRAAEMFHETYPDQPMTVLCDYFGREIGDSLEVCRRFPELAAAGRLSFRLDTHGGRYAEGLDPAASYAVLERHAPEAVRLYRTEAELRHLVGTGVTAAAIWLLREQLDAAGFGPAKIVASSGFTPAKCRIMAAAAAPIDVVGTGSYLPELWSETYATADIIAYDGQPMVKLGREFLLRKPRRR
ncbi:MAG TPA: nicotinate phosphoribosyltransferase [Stellaceae bacterium]|nr:nicotinate phosphoribosyltransferase [Stellaceae bacterium]